MTNHMTEAQIEQEIDRRVQRTLATDPGYRYAESAEDQKRIEDEITEAVERAVRRQYGAAQS